MIKSRLQLLPRQHLARHRFAGGKDHRFDAAHPFTPAQFWRQALDTLRQLPDFEALEDAGLLSKEKLLADDIMPGSSVGGDGAAGTIMDE